MQDMIETREKYQTHSHPANRVLYLIDVTIVCVSPSGEINHLTFEYRALIEL
jgi:hypothetical protein